MNICFATNNENKLREIQSLLGSEFHLLTLKDIGCNVDIPEPYDTITENSRGKADYIWKHFHINNFADDTGLEVYALNGDPGVRSARYAGPSRDSEKNIGLLLQNLDDAADRRARFVTVITLILDGEVHSFEGIAEGHILHEKRGEEGFGYDPVFVPEGYDRTFAEMDLDEKNRISHRSKAFSKLVQFLKKETHG
jgi:XTP/dITP diphosphohydrolase